MGPVVVGVVFVLLHTGSLICSWSQMRLIGCVGLCLYRMHASLAIAMTIGVSICIGCPLCHVAVATVRGGFLNVTFPITFDIYSSVSATQIAYGDEVRPYIRCHDGSGRNRSMSCLNARGPTVGAWSFVVGGRYG